VKVTRFDPNLDLIVVTARLWGHADFAQVSLAIDTGSSETVVTPDIVDSLGYSPRDGETITTVRSAIGKEQGYTLRIARFSALGSACRTSASMSSTSRRATTSMASSASASSGSSTTRSSPQTVVSWSDAFRPDRSSSWRSSSALIAAAAAGRVGASSAP
jgi:hypothetical protein